MCGSSNQNRHPSGHTEDSCQRRRIPQWIVLFGFSKTRKRTATKTHACCKDCVANDSSRKEEYSAAEFTSRSNTLRFERRRFICCSLQRSQEGSYISDWGDWASSASRSKRGKRCGVVLGAVQNRQHLSPNCFCRGGSRVGSKTQTSPSCRSSVFIRMCYRSPD
eukprot:PhF_6_TR22587/c0_g1_i3/m.32215